MESAGGLLCNLYEFLGVESILCTLRLLSGVVGDKGKNYNQFMKGRK